MRGGRSETFLGMMNLRGYLEKDRVTVDLSLTFSTIIFPVSISLSPGGNAQNIFDFLFCGWIAVSYTVVKPGIIPIGGQI